MAVIGVYEERVVLDKTVPKPIAQPPFFRTHIGHFLYRNPSVAVALGKFESSLLAIDEHDKPVKTPIYINGIARSGSTILLELLASHSGMATHRYEDFPFAMAPWWWRRVISLSSFGGHQPQERAHQDGIMVTPNSPEAMEELVWMAFFPQLHDPSHSAVLTAASANPEFETFYRKHIIKLLMLEKAQRYLAKGNYNTTRMDYLQRLFPDAKFIIPVRNPVTHIESLIRQHRLFSNAQGQSERVRMHMQAAGHYEFGPDRRPINVGNHEVTKAIMQAWAAGDEVRGLALLWNDVYGFVHKQLAEQTGLKNAAIIIRQEDYLSDTSQTIRKLWEHCQLEPEGKLLDLFGEKTKQKKEFPSALAAKDIETIAEITGKTSALYGYDKLI
jgi:hypothetical protein